MAMTKLKATLVMLQRLTGDDVQAALHTLGPAIEQLDRAAHDAGFRLRLIVMHPADAVTGRGAD